MVNSGNRRHLPSSPFKPPPEAPPVERYELDDLVTHDRYGLGRIILVEGDTAVVVDFAPRKVRITTPFARMTKLLPRRTADQVTDEVGDRDGQRPEGELAQALAQHRPAG